MNDSKSSSIDTNLPTYTCRICTQETPVYQVSMFDAIEFLSCQHCGSITTTPIPPEQEITEALNDSHYASRGVFSLARDKKHFIKHLNDLDHMTKGTKAIDLLCRNGYRVELARMNGFKDAIGIDTNKYCIEVANARFSKTNVKQMDLASLIKTGETYDVIFCVHGLEQTGDPDAYLQNIKKITHDKSLVYFSQTDGNHFMTPNALLRWKEIIYPERIHYISRVGLDALLKRNGFKTLKRYIRFLPYQHVITRPLKP